MQLVSGLPRGTLNRDCLVESYDGSGGVADVHRLGGVVIAQDEASSEFFSMPREAIQSGRGDVHSSAPVDRARGARLVALGGGAGLDDGSTIAV